MMVTRLTSFLTAFFIGFWTITAILAETKKLLHTAVIIVVLNLILYEVQSIRSNLKANKKGRKVSMSIQDCSYWDGYAWSSHRIGDESTVSPKGQGRGSRRRTADIEKPKEPKDDNNSESGCIGNTSTDKPVLQV